MAATRQPGRNQSEADMAVMHNGVITRQMCQDLAARTGGSHEAAGISPCGRLLPTDIDDLYTTIFRCLWLGAIEQLLLA